MLSPDQLFAAASAAGFPVESYERVHALVRLLQALRAHPFTKERVALKGGTALNLFMFELPRLSVDIDLNYIGAADVDTMRADRPELERAAAQICGRLGYQIKRSPKEWAGGKWILSYERAEKGRKGNLELDIVYTLRTPLWPASPRESRTIGGETASIIVLDDYELAAGKLAAAVARSASRDVFDARELLKSNQLPDTAKLRLGFVLYGSWNAVDWLTVTPESVTTTSKDVFNQLAPLLRADIRPDAKSVATWTTTLLDETRALMGRVLPLADHEREFIRRVNTTGEVAPELLTTDEAMRALIRGHAHLNWKVKNVKSRAAGRSKIDEDSET